MTLDHFKTSSGKKYSYRTWNAEEISSYLPTTDSLSVAHYISQTRIGGFIKQITNYEVVLLLPPKRISSLDLGEALEHIKHNGVYQVIIICFNYVSDLAGCSSVSKYWSDLCDSVALCVCNGFVDMTPIHHSLGANGSIWLVYDNEGASELLQMNNLKHQIEYQVASTEYSVKKLAEATKTTTYKGAVG